MAMENGSLLPEDVIIEILSWLPGKTLLQFTCVCKSWRAIITSSNFISKHLNNYYNNTNSGRLLSRYYISSVEDMVELFIDETLTDLSHQALDLPFETSIICGPCNGIFYLHICGGGGGGDSALWNPTTKEVKSLPKIITKPNLGPNISSSACIDACGFGFDPLSNDYKVVVFQGLWDGKWNTHCDTVPVVVYTLGTDSWRYWGDLPRYYYFSPSTCYTCLNGVFYWWGCYWDGNGDLDLVLSFDLSNEGFEEIQAPDYSRPALERLALYHDSIALLTVHEIEKFLDIWVINEGSWTKKLTIGPLLGVRNPAGYWKNDKLFLESDTDHVLLCDPNNQEIRDLQLQGTGFEILIYTESLVRIEDRNESRQKKENPTGSNRV